MNVEERLRAALESRAATASPNPGALAEIRARSDRRRWAVRLQVGVAAAAVAGIAAGAFALNAESPRRQPLPPVASETSQPTPSPSPSPAAAAGPVGRDEFVAILDDGRLAVVSAATGQIARTVLTGLDGELADVALSPDRRTVYLSQAYMGDCGASIERVDLATGARSTIVAEDAFPDGQFDLSPDGARLVYTGCEQAVHVRDLVTDETRTYPHSATENDAQGNPLPWRLSEVVWHEDGTRLWVVVDWENSTELRLFDPATDRNTGDAAKVPAEHTVYEPERSGADLVFLHYCCIFPDEPTDFRLILRSSSDGAERELVRSTGPRSLGEAQVGPDGDLLYVKNDRLFRLDVETGKTTDLGLSTALARDW